MEPASHPPLAQALPNEVLILVLQRCSRFTLYTCCLLNRNLYRLSVAYLYDDPFGRDQADYNSSLDKKPFHYLQIRDRGHQLCKTISENPDLATLVRSFWSTFWRGTALEATQVGLVLPHLRNLGSASVQSQHMEIFLSTCPSKALRRLYFGTFPVTSSFARWLQGQVQLQVLDLRDAYLSDEWPFTTLSKLQCLHGPYSIAASILPHSSQVIEFKGSVPQKYLGALLDLLRTHCPRIRTIGISPLRPFRETQAEMDMQMSQVDLIVLHVHGLPHLEVLEVLFSDDPRTERDSDGILGGLSKIAEGCPKLQSVRWAATEFSPTYRGKLNDHSFTVVDGSWAKR
ncbi:hypothetical protein FRB98_009264 [Tulasnella sp. 332]|nr:hypothetical protein FRB98_009264 [Tulasnella sp. 332]